MKGTGGSVLRLTGASQGGEPEPTLGVQGPWRPSVQGRPGRSSKSVSCVGSRIRTEERVVVTSSCQWHSGPGHVRAGK